MINNVEGRCEERTEGRKLLFIVNDPRFFLSHRLPIALEAKKSGYDVWVATMPHQDSSQIEALGLKWIALPLSRSGKQPLHEFTAMFAIWRLLWTIKPDLLHLVTIKPVLYGGIASRFAPVGGVVAAISGLGFVFVSRGWKAALLRQVVRLLYKLALVRGRVRVVFQNVDDMQVLLSQNVLNRRQARLIRGSGVDLYRYPYVSEPVSGVPVVCFASRLLRDKGVVEFVEAAKLVKQRGISVRFLLIGDPDPGNPTSITHEELESWRLEGIVEVTGHRDDIPRIFSQSHIVVLPSYYGEGLPKVLVEAAACGRAVVTTDHPGCRDAIVPNVSGLLVPVRDVSALAAAIERLLLEPEVRQRMGAEGRRLAEAEFSIDKIVQQHMDVYAELVD